MWLYLQIYHSSVTQPKSCHYGFVFLLFWVADLCFWALQRTIALCHIQLWQGLAWSIGKIWVFCYTSERDFYINPIRSEIRLLSGFCNSWSVDMELKHLSAFVDGLQFWCYSVQKLLKGKCEMESDGTKDIQEKKMMTWSVPLSKLKKKYVYCWGKEKETMFIAKQWRSPY